MVTLLLPISPACAGQSANSPAGPALPDNPRPQRTDRERAQSAEPCQLKRDGAAALQAEAAAAMAQDAANPVLDPSLKPAPCPPLEPLIDWYARFTNGPQVKPMTPKEKAWLAVRNLGDPFNAITILGTSAIAVASNSHSAFGPGFPGWARYVGDSYAEDATGEFFGTFLIPTIAHQDPHYHRLPNAGMKRRIAHAIYQVVWTQGDNGKEMLNYSNLVGFGIDSEIANLYVLGLRTDAPSTAKRYAITLATAPSENFITEFLPDVARRIHIHVVFVQWIVNQVAKTTPGSTP
jgi:hypothetical protein